MANNNTIKKVNTLNNWDASTNANIERLMDNATYTVAHPDDTLVIVGPPRLPAIETGAGGVYGDFAAVGMLQSISVNQNKPFQPMMAIGSSRSFYAASKAQGSAQLNRLFMNSDNLLKRLYQNAIEGNVKVSPNLEEFAANPPGRSLDGKAPQFLINLDSEFFLIPFGLGVIFKNKARQNIGGMYMELAVIPSLSQSIQAGQPIIMESVSVFFDRVVPLPMDIASSFVTGTLDKYTLANESAG